MKYDNIKQQLMAAQKLLDVGVTSKEKIDSLQKLLRGINPTLDQILGDITKAWSKIQKLQTGDVIELTAESIPEDSEENKKRKKALLLFIRSWKQLKSEVSRVQKELNAKQDGKQKTTQEQISSMGRIVGLAKGPFGLITLAAVLIVAGTVFVKGNKSTVQTPTIITPTLSQRKIQVITFDGKQIPLSEVYIGTGNDCDSPHYHAKDHTSVKATDGSVVADPGGCGFGRVKDVTIEEITITP